MGNVFFQNSLNNLAKRQLPHQRPQQHSFPLVGLPLSGLGGPARQSLSHSMTSRDEGSLSQQQSLSLSRTLSPTLSPYAAKPPWQEVPMPIDSAIANPLNAPAYGGLNGLNKRSSGSGSGSAKKNFVKKSSKKKQS
eukprot:g81903.t1